MRQPLSQSFRKGKETVKRKAKELSTLCGIPVCAVIVSPKGKTETWPESLSELKTIFYMYKEKVQIFDRHGGDPAESIDFQRAEDDEDELMQWLNTKIAAVESRIRILKNINGEKLEDQEGSQLRLV